jgi:kynurenine formamidase
MCSCAICNAALSSLSRRDLFALGTAGLAAGTLLASGETRAQTPPQKRLVGSTIPAANIADLTHVLSGDFPYIPIPGLTFPFKLTEIASIAKHGVYANKWELIEHNGTHIDSPSHFIAGQIDMDAVPAERLIVPIAVIDVTEKARRNHDATLDPDDILAWERRHGRLPVGAAVFMRSGWDRKAGSSAEFIAMDSSQTMHFPGFTEKTCEFLVRERDISGVGVDTISFDVGVDKEYRGHKALFRGGKWGIECLANLSALPETGAVAVIGAPTVKGASGGPCRVFAFWG